MSEVKNYSSSNPPSWAKPVDLTRPTKLSDFGFSEQPGAYPHSNDYFSVYKQLIKYGVSPYDPDRNPSPTPGPNPTPNPDPTPTPTPTPVPTPTPTPDPTPVPTPDPTPVPDPTPTPNPNETQVSGTRQANGQPNIFTFTDRNGPSRTLTASAGSGAIFNNLFAPTQATLNGPFAGYIGGRPGNDGSAGVNVTGSGGGVNAIVHSFTEFQDPTNNTAGTAPLNINLSNTPGSAPDRIIAIGGEGTISGVEFLTIMSSRDGSNGNGGFTVRGAQEVRIVAQSIDRVGTEGDTQIYRDERGSIYRIEGLQTTVTATGSRDRSVADNTMEDVPGPNPGYGIMQNGALPHNTVVTAPNGERINLAELSPIDRPLTATAQNDQPTPSAGLGTATRSPMDFRGASNRLVNQFA